MLAPVADPGLQAQLAAILDRYLADNTQAWDLGPDGSWTRRRPAPGEAHVNAQASLMAQATQRGAGPSAEG